MIIQLALFVGASIIVYVLLRALPLGPYQLRFCFVMTLTALFLGIFFGRYALSAVIAMILFSLGGLLALDHYERR